MWSARLATAVPPRALVPAPLMHLSLMVLLRRTTVVFPLHATALGGAIWEFIAVLALVRGFDCPISRALRLRGRPPFRIRCLCMGAVVEVTRRRFTTRMSAVLAGRVLPEETRRPVEAPPAMRYLLR